MLAGMFVASGPRLAAAVTNAGGIGVIGGLTLSPKQLRVQIADLKAQLNDKKAPFGVDLAIPKIGGGARKTNHDYTHGHLNELIDIIIEEKAKLFVCAIGVCPKEIVDKLHAGGVYVANVSGSSLTFLTSR
jgi:NAD(P)H-dependent flavin oxidoreductase YrpB (nitropropane dioxygenase family)